MKFLFIFGWILSLVFAIDYFRTGEAVGTELFGETLSGVNALCAFIVYPIWGIVYLLFKFNVIK